MGLLACLLGEWSKVRLHASYGQPCPKQRRCRKSKPGRSRQQPHGSVIRSSTPIKTPNGVENGRYEYLSEKPHGSAPARLCRNSGRCRNERHLDSSESHMAVRASPMMLQQHNQSHAKTVVVRILPGSGSGSGSDSGSAWTAKCILPGSKTEASGRFFLRKFVNRLASQLGKPFTNLPRLWQPELHLLLSPPWTSESLVHCPRREEIP